MPPKKITFFACGGLEEPTAMKYLPLGSELINKGYLVSCVTLHPDFKSLQKHQISINGMDFFFAGQMHVLKKGNKKIYFNKFQLIWVALTSCIKMIAAGLKIKPDVIYCLKPQPINGLAALIVKILTRKTLLLDCDDYEAELNRLSKFEKFVFALFEDQLPKFCEKVTYNTSYIKERYIKLGYPQDKFIQMIYAIDEKRFNHLNEDKLAKLRNTLRLNDKKVILFFGSISLHSGHAVDLLIHAFQKIKMELKNTVLLIVGGGDDFENLQNNLDPSIKNDVIFTGKVPSEEIPYYIKLANVSIDPVHDTLTNKGRSPWKIFESFAMGVPVVTSDVGDRKYYLENETLGILVRPGDTEQLAWGIKRILTDDSLASSLSKHCKENIKKYRWKNIVTELIDKIPSLN